MISKIKGTVDILPAESAKWQELEAMIEKVATLYHYKEIRTPIFEATELFHRGVGDTTDIIKKETYDFMDRGDRSITLRPEGTAAVVRSVIENKLYADPSLPLKYYYVGPMFRYERPQKGRQRQFHQFGAEAMGSYSPLVDAEVIAFAVSFLKALHVPGITVKINSLGDPESKAKYRQILLDYLEPNIGNLCKDCQARYIDNPLRVLDCKIDSESPILKNAPKPIDHLNEVSKNHFDEVLRLLDSMNVTYVIDYTLVRGLDYYTHTVFELVADLAELGNAQTIGGGGRYNDLVKSLEGPDFPAVGFAFGLERLVMVLDSLKKQEEPDFVHCFLITLGDEAIRAGAKIARTLRHGGLIIETDLVGKPLKGQFKQAERTNAMFTLILGDTELKDNKINVKIAQTGAQETVDIEGLYDYLINTINSMAHHCEGSCEECGVEC